jgi:hypothetical protein
MLDHYGWALRLVKKIRDGQSVADAVAFATTYAQDVRDGQCAEEAALQVGRSADRIRKNCSVPVAVIKRWQDAARELGTGEHLTDRKLANFLKAMFQEVQAAQIAEAVREASAQTAKAKDKAKAAQWRRAAANLEAMRKSITDGSCVAVPYPGKARLK